MNAGTHEVARHSATQRSVGGVWQLGIKPSSPSRERGLFKGLQAATHRPKWLTSIKRFSSDMLLIWVGANGTRALTKAKRIP